MSRPSPPETVLCPVCGAQNSSTRVRCSACGAKIEDVSAADSYEGNDGGRKPPENIEWRWVLAAALVYSIAEAIALLGLPLVVSSYDPQGFSGLFIVLLLWFGGGVAFGCFTPGKTYFEPAIGAMLTALPCMAYLTHITDVYELSPLAYVIGTVLGLLSTVIGAVLGDKFSVFERQPGHRRRTA